jgi:drug/metabolite transporter (DMT)-like permease
MLVYSVNMKKKGKSTEEKRADDEQIIPLMTVLLDATPQSRLEEFGQEIDNIPSPETETTTTLTTIIGICYCVASATMILFNKACMKILPAPCTVTFLQVTASTLIIAAAWCFGMVQIQSVDRATVFRYAVYSILFVLGINFTMRSLSVSNVETLLIFRSSSPILVSLIDTAFLGRALPSGRSCLSMAAIIFGATWFSASEMRSNGKGIHGISYNFSNLLLTSLLMTWGKYLTDVSALNLTTSVFLSNATSILPIFALAIIEKEDLIVGLFRPSIYSVGILTMSCVMGTSISYLGWKMRMLMSAASFTLIGFLNKILTILGNVLIWNDHATLFSIVGLCISMAGALEIGIEISPTKSIAKFWYIASLS